MSEAGQSRTAPTEPSPGRLLVFRIVAGLALAILIVAAFLARGPILRNLLDPKAPFQTYEPPPAPDYDQAASWALAPSVPRPGDPPADVFFVHPNTFKSANWSGWIDHAQSGRLLSQVMVPNYAGPFQRVGKVAAPRYRQATLYAMLSVRDDAREARMFAYGDVRRAFDKFLGASRPDRPIILVGVEQGGTIVDRLAREMAASAPLSRRLVAAYVIEAPVLAAAHGPASPTPLCARRSQAGCVIAYVTVLDGGETHARRYLRNTLVWGPGGWLEPLEGRATGCVNPLTGSSDPRPAGKAMNLGAANASNLEWGVRPAFLPHQVSARCEAGRLRVSKPRSPSLVRSRGWVDQMRAPGYNLFYADLEADAQARLAAWRDQRPRTSS